MQPFIALRTTCVRSDIVNEKPFCRRRTEQNITHSLTGWSASNFYQHGACSSRGGEHSRTRKSPFAHDTIFNGNRGVSVFFVISGFLITSLLLKEEQVTGQISIQAFYIRRVFRILPPFWIFLVVVAVLWKSGTIETSWANLGIAFTFLRDYISGDWWTGHSWSLSVEEILSSLAGCSCFHRQAQITLDRIRSHCC
jgi:peptidoglycan/LPS O-acetylase OafA/YrhL